MKLVGERRALAAVIMAFYFLLYGIVALVGMVPDFGKAFAAIAGIYGLAFFALVAGYFWARWFAVGVGLYGVITSIVGLWQLGAEPVILFMGGTHLTATLVLWGQAMSSSYDGQTAWREHFHMDDSAVQRLGRSVIRAGIMLPFFALYALAPRPADAGELVGLAALVLAAAGMRGLLQLKTWGVLAIGAAGALTLSLVGADVLVHGTFPVVTAIAGSLAIAVATPFLAPIARFVGLQA